MSKLPVILGNLDIIIDNVSSDFPNYLNSSYIPMRQLETCSKSPITFEVEEFVPCIPRHTQPHTVYSNHLYVYPRSLKYDSQKSFAKASAVMGVSFTFLLLHKCVCVLGLVRSPLTSPLATSAGQKYCCLR